MVGGTYVHEITVTLLARPSRAKRQGLHYHICKQMDVLSKHVQHWCSIWLDKQHIWWDSTLCPTAIFHTGTKQTGQQQRHMFAHNNKIELKDVLCNIYLV